LATIQAINRHPNLKALLSTEAHFSGFLIPAMKKTKTVRTHIDWEMTIPVLSTSHVKQTTLDALASASPERIALYPEGAFVHLQPKTKLLRALRNSRL
jgi:hypothetical protein